jgi:hypothetical protein
MTLVLAWHFVGDRLRDGSPIPEDGEVLEERPPLVMCKRGLHASERLIDALQYAPGTLLCRVVCSGAIEHEVDKLVCERRTILWRLDATEVLLEFARWCALEVAHLWAMPEVMREYLTTGDDGLRPLALREATQAAAALASSWAAAWAVVARAEAARAALVASWAAVASARATAARATAAEAARAVVASARTTAARAAEAGATVETRAAQNDRLTRMVLAARAAT